MLIQTLLVAVCLTSQTKIEPAHAQNSVFTEVLSHGVQAGGQAITLPPPRLVDGQSADLERALLREVAESDRAVDEMLRDSVTAPYIIKVRDQKASGATIRMADLWFVVYAPLEKIDPVREVARADQKKVEVANMSFETQMLKADEIRAAGIKPADSVAGLADWYAHVHARLLDRIEFDVTNHGAVSQSTDSMVVASRTDPSFDKAESNANCWRSVTATAGASAVNPAKQPYSGGISYAKISRCALKPGALVVEMHVAFVEPDGWFQGAPILRSKFGVIAQDQIRTLRRELAKRRAK
jgi:hypothetical protein